MTEALEMDSLFGQDRFDALVNRLWQIGGWTRDPEKDRAVVAQLARDFPRLDLTEEISKFETWVYANGGKKLVNNRGRHARLRNWCSNAVRFARTRPSGGHGAAPGRAGRTDRGSVVGGAPAPRAAFGERSGLVDW